MKLIWHLLLLAFFAPCSFAQTWTPATVSAENWFSIASSADGTKWIAAYQTGGIFISTNAGATWQAYSISNPTRVASSASGVNLAVAAGNKVYISTNGGTIWFSNVVAQDISGIASSADGTKLAAVNPSANGGHIFTSADGGMTWQTNTFPAKNWTSVASSADGTRLIATANTIGTGAGIYTSTNSGSTWVSNTVPVTAPDWGCSACSADGTKLAAGLGGNGGAIFTSTNSGSSWISNTIPHYTWNALACSADGSRWIAASGGFETIYTLTNSGTNWVSNSVPSFVWTSVASSADGNSLIAVCDLDSISGSGSIYRLQTTPSPQLNLTASNSNVNLSWIIPSTNFVLQSSVDMSHWSDVTNPPVLNLTNLQQQISLPLSGSSGFFRLSTGP